MSAAIVVGLALLCVLGGLCAAELVRRRQAPAGPLEYLGHLVRLRVIVHTKDDRSIRGVLVADYPDCIVLDAPEYLVEPQVETLKGRAVVLRGNLAWIQVLSDDGS